MIMMYGFNSPQLAAGIFFAKGLWNFGDEIKYSEAVIEKKVAVL